MAQQSTLSLSASGKEVLSAILSHGQQCWLQASADM